MEDKKPGGGMRTEEGTHITHEKVAGEPEVTPTKPPIAGAEPKVDLKAPPTGATLSGLGRVRKAWSGELTKTEYEQGRRLLSKPLARVASNLGQGNWLVQKPLAAVSLGSALFFAGKAGKDTLRYVGAASLKKDADGKEIPVSIADIGIESALAAGSMVIGGIGGANRFK